MSVMFVVRVVVKRHSKWFYCGNCDELLGVLRHGVFSKRFWMGKKAAEAGRPWAFEVREPPVECPCCMRPVAYPGDRWARGGRGRQR